MTDDEDVLVAFYDFPTGHPVALVRAGARCQRGLLISRSGTGAA
jgi:hypothetical protein